MDFWKNYWPNFVAGLSYTALWAFLSWLATPPTGAAFTPLSVLMIVVMAIFGAWLFVVLQRNFLVLAAGGDAPGTRGREAYDALRARLAYGGLAAELYSDWLETALNKVDRFFGDADYPDRTLFPHAFGLRKPAPLWTALAYDRCLLLALIYPVATIFLTWTIANHIGVAETALHLPDQPDGWLRALAGLSVAPAIGVGLKLVKADRFLYRAIWMLALRAAAAAAAAVSAANCIGLVFVLGAIILAATNRYGAVAVAAVLVVVVTIAIAVSVGVIVGGGAGLSMFFLSLSVLSLSHASFQRNRQGVFLSLFSVVSILACLVAAHYFGSNKAWVVLGPLLLFLGLLTLLNAPFDWFCLGLTRALLRRGLERGGWWPYAYAFLDAGLTTLVVILLALVMILGIQAYDELALYAGAKQALMPLDDLLSGIAATPSDPKNWWVYALLLSTFFPSLINLAIAGCALIRGFPGVAPLLLRFMPAGGAVSPIDRTWIALVLTGQILAGVLLGVGAQALLVVGIFQYVLPSVGLELFDLAGDFAALDLPGKALSLLKL
jgi:hypothetical protein